VHSVTKVFTGAVVAAFLDRGFIDLDAPVGRYLPRLVELDMPRPLTLRMLLTHTSGLDGHDGDEHRDLEERVADLLPHLESPVTHLYTGRGFALAVKALEMVSGLPRPDLYDRVLLHPLGLRDTALSDSHGGATTTAWDLAVLGQMMLNGGAYGPLRFFGPHTVESIKPRPLTSILGPDTPHAWGIGFWGSREPERRMLGGTALGHGSRNASTFRIDPGTGLILTIASLDDQRTLTDPMRRELVRMLEDAIVDPPPDPPSPPRRADP
jgi:CubicO group peptidase (beta-lactamase class C family)